MRLARRIAVGLLAILCALMPAVVGEAQDDRSPDAALDRLLREARADCGNKPADRLERVLCSGRIRIGAREYYPLFATAHGDERDGYEIDVARTIARRFGVEIDFLKVSAANRIPLLAEDRIDMVIATMGHNMQRDGQIRFVRPHYYQSETVIVGPKKLEIRGWDDLANLTVCVTIGNGSNAEIVSHRARLMLFDEAGVLPARLEDETCLLAAQDDSFFADYFTDPAFADRFEQKFGFARVPWGMAVARTGSDRLGRALDLLSQILHRDGVFLEIARRHHISTTFLEQQEAVWRRPDCNTDTGSSNSHCVLPALNAELQPTPFAPSVDRFEQWVERTFGLDVTLPMLKTRPAFQLFVDGMVNSLVLIAGALTATLLFAVVFGATQSVRWKSLRWPARLLTITLQSTPIVLTLVIAAAFAHALLPYSASVALGAGILALGLVNGANAGQAIGEAMATLRAEHGLRGRQLFGRAIGRSATQIVAFLVNAAKGTPAASIIGAPELLSALTDVTSFSSGRVTTYCVLLVFYTAVVMIVVVLCGRLQIYLQRRGRAA